MNQKFKYTFNKGMNRDISKDKHPGDFYYEANAIRIMNTDSQSLYSVSNEKGNELKITLPSPSISNNSNFIIYDLKLLPFINSDDNEIRNSTLPLNSGEQTIIGHAVTRNGIVLFSTDSNGFDCIWKVDDLLTGGFDVTLLYCRDLQFSINNPIQALFNYENENIQKVYWVDGVNQLRYINIQHSIENGDIEELIDVNANSLNIVGDYKLSQIKLNETRGGGIHTSGVIQYSYNLYKLNGSQTSLAPISEQIQLDKGFIGGGAVNEVVGTSVSMIIPNLDENYTHIKIYAIKYTSLNELPEISLIQNGRIDNYENFNFTDNGVNISTLTLAEFTFLGGNPLVPRHIQSKDNRLFAGNLKDTGFELDIDTRAYSFTKGASGGDTTKLYTGNIEYLGPNSLQGSFQEFSINDPVSSYNYLKTDDAINPSFDTYRFDKSGAVGGEGQFIKYNISSRTIENITNNEDDLKYLKFFKDNEIYRIGIIFYNKLGQQTDVKWIADFKSLNANLNKLYSTLKVEILQPAFDNHISSLNLSELEKPVGYKIVRAERTNIDKTILCQGILNGTMIQSTVDADNFTFWDDENNRKERSKDFVKLPSLFSRGFEPLPTSYSVHANHHLRKINTPGPNARSFGDAEIYAELNSDFKVQQTWQYNKMYQMFSPEITFDEGITFGSNLEFNIKGLARHSTTNLFKQVWNNNSKQFVSPLKIPNAKTYQVSRPNDRSGIHNLGIFGPRYNMCKDNTIEYYLFNDNYKTFISNGGPLNDAKTYNIYGSPEITERGAGVKAYNNDSAFQYANTVESIISDGFNDAGCCCGGCDDEASIQGINSWGAKSLMLVEGAAGLVEDDRKSLRNLLDDNGMNSENGLLIAEVTRPDSYIYTTGIYGGLSAESKSRTTYIEIGSYSDIEDNQIVINSPGDTYVQPYRVARLSKTDTQANSCRTQQLTNTIEVTLESSINLLNRNDSSLLSWDNEFQPRYDDYHKYNSVYSQESNLLRRASDSLTVRNVNKFDTRIISSKLKTPNETIDSWTDFLVNDTIDLDGKYGALNNLVNVRDEIYTLQDTAVSRLSINPRIQTQGSDGVSIELGRGAILYDYNYLTTQSGSLNKWSVTESPNSFYYLDIINKSYMRVSPGNGVKNISDTGGHHAFFQNNLNVDDVIIDNPLLQKGVVGGYDTVNGDAFLTVLQDSNPFTIRYNEKNNAFHSFEPYTPSRYINKGDVLLTTHPDDNKLYEHYSGDYNIFYDKYHPSYITILINPNANLDCVFNNFSYKSECYIDDIDKPNDTLTHYQAWNEYQNTGRVQLVLGRDKNLRRKFRDWSAIIGRNEGTRDRMRNPWLFLKLELDRNDNSKFILHDVIIDYTPVQL